MNGSDLRVVELRHDVPVCERLERSRALRVQHRGGQSGVRCATCASCAIAEIVRLAQGQSALDECAQSSDCVSGECGFDANEGHLACMMPNCVIGRPFLVHGAERRAEPASRSDWQEKVTLTAAQLPESERRELAARWQAIASMEHASIAAFARFALQLLSFGAPAELLERTHAALADETRHAKTAFGIASSYSGRETGPGPLAMDGALAEHGLRAAVVNAVLEGCIGETVAAAEAAWGAERAEHPVLRDVLGGIAADEGRHAELAFSFVHWAVVKDPKLISAVLATAHAQLARTRPSEGNPADEWLTRHGLLPEHRRAKLRNEALEEMVLPCLRAICMVERAA